MERKTHIAVFDALDTVQGYRGAELGKSKQFYQDHIAGELGISREEMLQTVPYERQLELTGQAIQRGNLEPVILPGVEYAFGFVKGLAVPMKPVIVTADLPECAALTTQPLVDVGLLTADDVYGIAELGSKKDPETWRKAQAAYFAGPGNNVAWVFEDTEGNLRAAMEAYDLNSRSGFLVKHEDAGRQELEDGVHRGNLGSLVTFLGSRAPF